MRGAQRGLATPTVWAILSGLGLLLACALPADAPDWLFWASAFGSGIAATGWAILAPPKLDD